MTNIEKVEKLREKANVNYAEAKDALERSDWDILDAMILLEKEGKTPTEQQIIEVSYTTKEEEPTRENTASGNRPGFGELLGRFFRWLSGIIKLGNANEFVVDRYDETLLGIPVTVFVLLTVFCFWAVIPLLIVGLFFGFRYSFTGPNLGRDSINNVMHKASDVAHNIKDEIKTEINNEKSKKDSE